MWAVVQPVAFFLSGDEDVIFEGHDLAAAEEGLFDEGERPVFESFVFVYF